MTLKEKRDIYIKKFLNKYGIYGIGLCKECVRFQVCPSKKQEFENHKHEIEAVFPNDELDISITYLYKCGNERLEFDDYTGALGTL